MPLCDRIFSESNFMTIMNEMFGFDLPDRSVKLADRDYVNLVNRIRGNFLSYVSVLDHTLSLIITEIFLRDKDSIALWTSTVFDEDRVTFGAKIIWLSRIISNSELGTTITDKDRVKLQKSLDFIRNVRNDFAHNHAYNKQIVASDIEDRVIRLYEFEGGVKTIKLFKMQEIMDIINDTWVLEQLTMLQRAAERVRDR